MSAVAQRFPEPLGVLEEVGPVLEDGHGLLGLLDVVEELGVLLDELEDGVPEVLFLRLDLLDGVVGGRLPAPDAEVLLAGSLLPAARAVHRRDGIGLVVLVDLGAVDLREFAVGVLAEDADVAGGDVAAADPAVVVLDVGLVHALRGEVARGALPEVGEGDGLVHARVLRSALEDLREHPVGELLGTVQLAPQRCVRVIPRRVIGEPALEVRDGRDQRDRPLPGLPLEGELVAVAVVGDVADGKAADLSAARAGVPGDGDERGVSAVVRRLDHREDVLLPVEHVAGVRCGVVVPGRSGRHPVDAIRWVIVVTVGDAATEDAERDPEVPVRLDVVVGAVDPADEFLRGVSVLQRVGKPVDLFGHVRAVAEELEVAVVAVLLLEEVEFVAELQEDLPVVVADVVGLPDPLAHVLDLRGRISHTSACVFAPFKLWHVNRWFKSGRRHPGTGRIGFDSDPASLGFETPSFEFARIRVRPSQTLCCLDEVGELVGGDEPLRQPVYGLAVDEHYLRRHASDLEPLDQRRVVAGVDRRDDGVGGVRDCVEHRLHGGADATPIGVELDEDAVVSGDELVEGVAVGEVDGPGRG